MEIFGEQCSKIDLEDGRSLYFSIKEENRTDKKVWSIIFTDGKGVWKTFVNSDMLSDMADGSSYSSSEFVNLFLMAFNLRTHSGGEILKYTLKSMSAGSDRFIWSIYLPKDKRTFKLGHLDVSPLCESERGTVYCAMFDSLLAVTENSRTIAKQSQRLSEEEKKTATSALKKLESYVSRQEQAELILYTNFVSVLNEKKRKIRELQDQCEALRQSIDHTAPTTDNATLSVNKKGKTTAGRRTKISACKAPSSKRTRRSAGALEYDSDKREEDDSQPMIPSAAHSASRRSKPLSQTDDEATDVDESPEPTMTGQTETMEVTTQSLPHKTQSTLQLNRSTELISDKTDTLPGKTSKTGRRASTVLKAETSTNTKVSTVTSSSARSASDELDDLLGQEPTSTTSDRKSPVKRRGVPRKPAPVNSSTVRAPGTRSKSSQDEGDLIEDLLEGL